MTEPGTKKEFQIKTVVSPQMFVGDIENLQLLLESLGPKPCIVEIGSWTGHSAIALALYAKAAEGHVTCVDTFDGRGSMLQAGAMQVDIEKVLEENLNVAGVRDVVTIMAAPSEIAYEHFPYNSIDLLFIDGDHRYDAVRQDIENWLPRVRGIICGHDYDIDAWNVAQDNRPYEFNDRFKDKDCEFYVKNGKNIGVHHGVIQAVHDFFGKDVVHYGRIWFKDLRDKKD